MHTLKPALAAALCAALAPAVQAETLTPGAEMMPTGTTLSAEPQLAGSVVEDRLTPFSYTGWFTDNGGGDPVTTTGVVSGFVQSRVLLSVDGTYDFYWRVALDAGAFLPVSSLDIAGVPPDAYNANWRSDGVGQVAPTLASEGLDGGVGWYFGYTPDTPTGPLIGPGETSYYVFLDTDAHSYNAAASFTLASMRSAAGPGSMQIDWGGESGSYATFGPGPAPVPEPAAAGELMLGLSLLPVLARRCRRRAGRRRART